MVKDKDKDKDKENAKHNVDRGGPMTIKITNFCDGDSYSVAAQDPNLIVQGFARRCAAPITCQIRTLMDQDPPNGPWSVPATALAGTQWIASFAAGVPQAGTYLLEAYDTSNPPIKDSMIVTFTA
jgi:hypothetical protein